jgi:hypothetical protein
VLSWSSSVDNSGEIASYNILIDGTPLLSLPGTQHLASVRTFHPTSQTVYRLQAVDGAGNAGKASTAVVVLPTAKPTKLPKPLPRWAWSLFTWQHGHKGARPKAPAKPAAWYWRWAGWRAAPFHVKL